ncbi:LysR substrate-binding domain-containing protein [Streptomyces sp. NPDC054794]
MGPGITLTVVEAPQDRIEADLLVDDLDLGIAFSGSHPSGINATPLFAEALILVAAARHTATADKDPVPVQALSGQQLALLNGDFATRRHVDAYFSRHRVRPRITVEANSVHALAEIVQRTPLATVLPHAIAYDHARPVSIPLDPPLPTRTVTLLTRADAYQSAAARALTHLIHGHVRARAYDPGWAPA